MKRLLLLPAAESDLDGIFDYTTDTWGPEQAVRYLTDIRDHIRSLCSGEKPGKPYPRIARVRQSYVGRHTVYFLTDADTLTIIRILHQSMDPSRHV